MTGNATTSFAEVAEGVRAAIAAYTQTLADGRTVDVVTTLYPDGVRDIPALAPTKATTPFGQPTA